jgi:tetratricopeptide (TPR) repeat protein/transcriptional regulator with XRE-family HTH domain
VDEEPGYRFGELLRRYRVRAGLSQAELAERAGLSVRALSDMERGRTTRPFIRSVRLLCDALSVPETGRTKLFGALQPSTGSGVGLKSARAAVTHAPSAVPRQLPAAVAHFTGRAAELELLTGLLAQVSDGARPVVIAAIGGTAGVGKTALALRFAHQAAARFRDGQLYVDLRGFGPGPACTAAEALCGFLGALGVSPERIPAGLDAQAALYRSILSGRRMLVVLDNARDEQQVRPLLPGGTGWLAVVTSRKQLTGLAAADGAHLISLDVLSDPEAIQLLAARLGPERVKSEPDAAARLSSLCARLPLALTIAGARAAARASLTLASLAEELRCADSRLDALDDTDPLASIRTVLSWSYQDLRNPAARMFRLLGIHPGPDISAQAAASLVACTPAEARSLLRELTGWHMLTEPVPDRFCFHDLLRAYAAEQANVFETGAGRRAARARLLDHYLHTAHAAALLLRPSRDPITLSRPNPGTTPEHLDGYPGAMARFTAERRILLDVVEQAAFSRSDVHAWQLPWALEAFLDSQGYWHDLAATQRTALTAAERLGDLAGQAHAHRNIGHARFWLGFTDDARAHLSHALELYQQVDDRVSQARVQLDLGRVFESLGLYREALSHSAQALSLFRAASHQSAQVYALNAVGWFHAHLGDQRRALDCCQQALALASETADHLAEACISDSLGYIRRQLGEHDEAVACYQNALRLHREFGNLHDQAEALIGLGDTCHSHGDRQAARSAWQQAITILERLDHQDASKVRAKLAGLAAMHKNDCEMSVIT